MDIHFLISGTPIKLERCISCGGCGFRVKLDDMGECMECNGTGTARKMRLKEIKITIQHELHREDLQYAADKFGLHTKWDGSTLTIAGSHKQLEDLNDYWQS